MPPRIAAICATRPYTCAIGRNSRVEAWPEPLSWNTSCQPSSRVSASVARLPWVSRQPLGRPVVPEV